MKYALKMTVMILCILLASGSLYGQNEQEKKRKNVEKPPNNLGAIRQAIVVNTDLLDAYARIMRYQTAWQDVQNQTFGNETTPDDYLTIAISNVAVGDLKKLSNYLKAIRQPSSDVLTVDREMRCAVGGVGDCELAYDVRWAKEGAKYGLKFNMPNTGDVDKYITYDITVEYKEKSLTHGGVIVHYRNKNAGFMIYDGIIPQIDELILDRQPLIAEPRLMSRVFSGVPPSVKVKELPPAKVWSKLPEEEEIIGWLPNDEFEPEELEDMSVMMLSRASCCDVPTGETTVGITDISGSTNGLLCGGIYTMRLDPTNMNFSNLYVTESVSLTDSCPQIPNAQLGQPQAGTWYDNPYQDVITISAEWANYHAANGHSCSATVAQTLSIYCPSLGTTVSYKQNTISFTVTSSGTTGTLVISRGNDGSIIRSPIP